MGFNDLKWFGRKRKEKEEAQSLLLDEVQGLKKLLRKQSIMIEEVHREQEAIAAQSLKTGPILDLCDAIFYLHRAFQNPGLMSRQHAQVLNMVLIKANRVAASFGLEMVMEEGTPFDPGMHEAVSNRSPGAELLEVTEVVQPGYLRDGKVLRAAKVVVGATNALSASDGSTPA